MTRILTAEEAEFFRQQGWLIPGEAGQPGKLVAHVEHDQSGRPITTFVGDKSVWMDAFKAPVFLQLCLSNDPKWSKYIADQRKAEMGITS